MKKAILTIILGLIGIIGYSQNTQYVSGYYRSNGTYVQGYYRTVANNTVYDNYSTYPNVNPYTGATGTKHYSAQVFTYPTYTNTYPTYTLPTYYYYPSYSYGTSYYYR
jgi:hypothetical protein